MKKQFINKDWYKNGFSWIVLGIPALMCIIMVVCFNLRSCRPLWKDSHCDVFMPDSEGFVGKANKLLDKLLMIENTNIKPSSIHDLSKRYPAFIFALPYEEDDISYAADIRLVGINPSYLSNEDKEFFYNSRLKSLLESQGRSLEEKLFKIKVKGHGGYITIDKIELIASMFKVALKKDPWIGDINAQQNSIYDSLNCLYISYGDYVLPLMKLSQKSKKEVTRADLKAVEVKVDVPNTQLKNTVGGKISYYDYYETAIKNHLYTRLILQDRAKKNIGILDIKYYTYNDTNFVRIKPENGISCHVYNNNKKPQYVSQQDHASKIGDDVIFTEGMKIVVTSVNEKSKIAEFTITRSNPALKLSSITKTNKGKSRYFIGQNHTDLFTQQILRGLSSNLSNTTYESDINLSIDPILSYEIQNDIKNFVQKQKNRPTTDKFHHVKGEKWDMSVTIMDMNTGEILATPYYSDMNENVSNKLQISRRNTALVHRYIGSTFKPMLALATVLGNPELLNFNLRNTNRLTDKFVQVGKKNIQIGQLFGLNTISWAQNHWNRDCDMKNFLSHSDDLYPVALAALGLNDAKNDLTNPKLDINKASSVFTYKSGDDNIYFSGVSVSNKRLFHNLDALYDIYDYKGFDPDSLRMMKYLWRDIFLNNSDDMFGLTDISPDDVCMKYSEFEDNTKTLFNTFKTWVLGQGSNEWNCIKLAEAWTRMLTKRARHASFMHSTKRSDDDNICESIKSVGNSDIKEINSTWNSFLDIFNNAQSIPGQDNTLYKMYETVNAFNSNINGSGKLLLFSKTGTPDSKDYIRREVTLLQDKKRTLDVAMYSFGLMTSKAYSNVKNNKSNTPGIVCIIRITRSYIGDPVDDGLWSFDARDFISNPQQFKKFYDLTRRYYK